MAVDVRVDAHFDGSCPIRRRLFFVILDQVPIKAFDMGVAIKGSVLFMRINQFPVNRFLLSRTCIEAMNEPLARSVGKKPMEDPGWEQSHAELCSEHTLEWPRDVSSKDADGIDYSGTPDNVDNSMVDAFCFSNTYASFWQA